VGAIAGTAALVVSLSREHERRRFLAVVRGGRSDEFRIEEIEQKPMVVRVSVAGHAYRGSTIAEPVVLLDESGDTRSRLSV